MFTAHKKSALILLLLLIPGIVFGQALIGGHIGLSLSSLSGDKDNDENSLRVGINPYISLDFPINYIISVETGISYAMQGMTRKRVTQDGLSVITTTTDYKLDYIQVPVYLKENFTNFYGKIGAYGAYAVNAVENWEKSESKYGVITNTKDINVDFPKSINMYDIGISIGFGYIHYFTQKRRRSNSRRRVSKVLQVNLRYDLGFVPLDLTGTNSDLDIRNRMFSIGLSLNTILD